MTHRDETIEQELFKSRAREQGTVKLIGIVTARLDARTDSILATLPSLQLNDVRIDAELVSANQRLLTGGFYAEIQLEYDAIIVTCPPETGPTSVLGSALLGGRQYGAKATLPGNHHPQAARG